MKPDEFLKLAGEAVVERGQDRDAPDGERSMAATVGAFNAIYDLGMTEVQGWQFMAILKIVRSSQGNFRADDFIDQAGYSALAGEAAEWAKWLEFLGEATPGRKPK